MDTEDLRYQIQQLGDLLAMCQTEQRSVLEKLQRVSADLSAVASAIAPRPKLSTRDWAAELAALEDGSWVWEAPTKSAGWWAVRRDPRHSRSIDIVPLRDITEQREKVCRSVFCEIAKLVDERDDVERGR
ncbi:MAG: hypothetical protein IPH07_24055 [Deltaproteobacteria bacterium]|nr:hypothetical protein [Deltaproteobacteria bacterium]